MKIYLYFKVDRGYYESAHAAWKQKGGNFDEHLLRAQATFYSWKREFERLGCEVKVDLRSSFLLPQARRRYLPMAVSNLMRGGLWITKFDPWLLQRDIIRQIERYQPDIAFFPIGSSVWESTLAELKERKVTLAQWCSLPVNTMMERDRVNIKYFDLLLQPANLGEGFRQAGATGRIEYVPIGVNPEVHRPVVLTAEEHQRYQSDVCFIGGLSSRFHSERRKTIEYAIEQGIEMKIWGGYREHFVDSPILSCWQGQVWGEEQVKVMCATKIGLNFHVDHVAGELDQGLNVRAFELPACGVFQLLQRVPSVGEFFEEDKEIVCFETKEEMLDKIRYYLLHTEQRQKIAEAGKQRVLRDHVWAKRVMRMVELFRSL